MTLYAHSTTGFYLVLVVEQQFKQKLIKNAHGHNNSSTPDESHRFYRQVYLIPFIKKRSQRWLQAIAVDHVQKCIKD